MGRNNWAKRFNKFWQLSLQQFNTEAQEVPYTAAVTPTSETSVEIQASQSPGLRADTG